MCTHERILYANDWTVLRTHSSQFTVGKWHFIRRLRMIVQTKRKKNILSAEINWTLALKHRRVVARTHGIQMKIVHEMISSVVGGCLRYGVGVSRRLRTNCDTFGQGTFSHAPPTKFSSCEKHLFSRTPSPRDRSRNSHTSTQAHTSTLTEKRAHIHQRQRRTHRTEAKKIYRASLVQFSSPSTTATTTTTKTKTSCSFDESKKTIEKLVHQTPVEIPARKRGQKFTNKILAKKKFKNWRVFSSFTIFFDWETINRLRFDT